MKTMPPSLTLTDCELQYQSHLWSNVPQCLMVSGGTEALWAVLQSNQKLQ